MVDDTKKTYAQKYIQFINSDVFECFFNVLIKLEQNLITFFFGFHEKNMDFGAKNDHFSKFDKITGNDNIRLLYSSK